MRGQSGFGEVIRYSFSEAIPIIFNHLSLKVILSLLDRYDIFSTDWFWIEVCHNVVLTKIDITMEQ